MVQFLPCLLSSALRILCLPEVMNLFFHVTGKFSGLSFRYTSFLPLLSWLSDKDHIYPHVDILHSAPFPLTCRFCRPCGLWAADWASCIIALACIFLSYCRCHTVLATVTPSVLLSSNKCFPLHSFFFHWFSCCKGWYILGSPLLWEFDPKFRYGQDLRVSTSLACPDFNFLASA